MKAKENESKKKGVCKKKTKTKMRQRLKGKTAKIKDRRQECQEKRD